VGPEGEGVLGLHAVLAVGYDDSNHVVTIKNSWGTEWGEGGYGRLTYQYVERYGIEMLGLEL
jgi:C1A family cysteine protease